MLAASLPPSPPDAPDARPLTKPRLLSCGVLVASDGRLLLGQPTGRRFWDIPKGVAEPGEAPADCARRELEEETGLVAPPAALRPLGQHRYLPAKELILFAWPAGPIDPAALRCRSMVTWPDGRRVPELSRFALFTWDQALSHAGPSLSRVLGSIGRSTLAV